MRGLGAVDVSRLALAAAQGQFHPAYRQGLTWNPSYLPASMGPQPLAPVQYADDATAQQIASLLGGSVSKKVPYGVWQGSNVPLANWIETSDGSTLAGDLATQIDALHGSDARWNSASADQRAAIQCEFERAIAMSVPGGAVSESCGRSSQGWTAEQQTPGVVYTPPDPVATYGTVPTQTVTTGTPGASVGVGQQQQQAQQQNQGAPVTTNLPIQLPGSLSAIPWWGWALAAGVGLWAVKGK